jgi:hypothetical protein
MLNLLDASPQNAVLLTTVAVSLTSAYFLLTKTKPKATIQVKDDTKFPTPEISPVDEHFNWETQEPYPYRPFKKGLYKMNLAIRKLDPNDIICIENTYLERIQLRERLFDEEKLYGCHESAIDSLKEAYAFIFNHLLKRYPQYFVLSKEKATIENKITGKNIPANPDFLNPGEMLKTIATNIEEDVLLLIKNPSTEQMDEYILRAAVSLFPAGFNPIEKLNQPLTKIHGPVPGYLEKLQTSMNKFFGRLKVNEYIARNNWSFQTHTNLCAPTGSHATKKEASTIHPLYPDDLDFNKCFFRVEKQCFTRLPKSEANIMFIRTYTTSLLKLRGLLTDEQKEILSSAIDGLTGDLAVYKRRIQWGEPTKVFLKGESDGSHPTLQEYTFAH